MAKYFFEFLLFAAAFFFIGASASAADRPLRVVVFGDSLTSGYQLAPEDSFPVKLQRKLSIAGYQTEVINMSVAGETSSGGLARVDSVLAKSPDIVLVEFGINDALRGIDPNIINNNLYKLIHQLKYNEIGEERGIYILLIGMKAPPNLGYQYTAAFENMFLHVAGKLNVSLLPFFLEGVAGQPQYNLADGIHPNTAGVEVTVENAFPYIQLLLDYHKYADDMRQYRKDYMDQSSQWSAPAAVPTPAP